MSRVLLADPSSHAQRMGGEILKSEGFQVAFAADADAALSRLKEFDPLVILADVLLPGKTGYELCSLAKADSAASVAVILTAGAQASIDPDKARGAGSNASLSKPFEATVLVETVKRLASQVAEERRRGTLDRVDDVDRERVEAAVTVAMEAAMPTLIREITARVLVALKK